MKKLKSLFGNFCLKVIGWKIVGEIPSDDKYVAVIAPHTSFIDMIIGKFYNWAIGMEPKIMVKKEFFWFPMSLIIKSWGGIPVDRKKAGTLVEQMTELFSKRKKMVLAIAPEGTRSLTSEWKTGFHRIAKQADVPVYLFFVNFKNKTLGSLGKFIPSNEMEADIIEIKSKYKDIEGFHKEKFTIE